MILAIDPGNVESAYVLMYDDLTIFEFAKKQNEEILEMIKIIECLAVDKLAIEMVAHYGTGMPAGKEIFDTCVWIGRFIEAAWRIPNKQYIYRKDEKINLCGSMKAKDGNIIQALIDRFAPNVKNKGKGDKKNPGWFYGFKDDIWQAYAVGVTYHDMYLKEVQNG